MEAVALHALLLVAPRNGKEPRDARHAAVEGGVEAGHLWQLGMTPAERLDQLDLARQVIGIGWADASQVVQ